MIYEGIMQLLVRASTFDDIFRDNFSPCFVVLGTIGDPS